MTYPSLPAMRRRSFGGVAAVLSLAAVLAACERKPEVRPDRLTLTPAAFKDLPGWADDGVADALPALRRSCAVLTGRPADQGVGPNGVAGKIADWVVPCSRLPAVPAADNNAARAFFEEWFKPYAVANNDKRDGLFTGYYEPELNGSRTKAPGFSVPIYRRPADLVSVDLGRFSTSWKGERTAGVVVNGQLRPYADRAAIESGALAGQGLELAWVNDPISAFFLQIQGSGRIHLADGGEIRVGYAGENGHRYVAIGKELIDRGALKREEVSLQSIRDWLEKHPADAPAVMDANPSYVFFQEQKGDGPLGTQGVVLTPGRSLAVDAGFLPLGAPVWLDADDPSQGRMRRLLIAQDTGGAIRGPVRGDVFWGYGADAEKRAGRMRSRGTAYILLPKSIAAAS